MIMSKRKLPYLLLVSLLLVFVPTKAIQLSEKSIVSVITCAPGTEVYSLFGHTALRIEDKSQNLDIVFNYGLFSFSSTNFYWNFFKGYTDYVLGAQKYNDFMREFINQKRSVWYSEVNLTRDQKNELLDFLLNNLKPENRTYRYNYFDNNCATKIVDLIEEVCPDGVAWNEKADGLTYRKSLIQTLDVVPWVRFGVDLVLGADADTTISFYDEMFLPKVLMRGVGQATVSNIPLQKSSGVLYNGESVDGGGLINLTGPFVILGLLFLCVFLLTVYGYQFKKWLLLLDFILLFTFGLAGLFVLTLSVLSVHPTVSSNFNLLWLNPLYVIFAFVLFKKSEPKWAKLYKACSFLLLIIFCILALIRVQTAYVPLYFLVGVIGLRLYSSDFYKLLNKK